MSLSPQFTQNPHFGSPNVPRGERNNNIGNIDFRADRNRPGQLGSDGGFIRFASPEQGVQAAVEILHVYRDKYGLNTLRGLIGRWALPGENNTANYIAHMERHVGVGADQRLDLNDPTLVAKIIQAKGLMENSAASMQRTFTPQVIARGVQLAFEQPSSITGQRHTPTGAMPSNAPNGAPAAGTQVAGATPQGQTPAGAGTGQVRQGSVMTGQTPPAQAGAARPSGGAQQQQPQQQGGDMFEKIVMALLAMLFGAGATQMAQAEQPQRADVGNLTPGATPPAPAQPQMAAPAIG